MTARIKVIALLVLLAAAAIVSTAATITPTGKAAWPLYSLLLFYSTTAILIGCLPPAVNRPGRTAETIYGAATIGFIAWLHYAYGLHLVLLELVQ